MSPVTGQVPAKAVEILRIGVDRWKRERQTEKKKESMNGVFIEREETNRKSHYTKFSPDTTGHRYDFRSIFTWSRK